jgi:peroxiredoxin
MDTRKFVCFAAALAVGLSVGGCGRSAQPPDQANRQKTEGPNISQTDEVKVASAESKVAGADERIEPAVARVPADHAVDPKQPALLPPGARAPIPLEEPLDSGLSMPRVFLTEEHAKTCLVKVGDPFPGFELANLAGQKQPLGELQGKNLTIVVFWSGKQATARDELADLQSHFLPQFAERGVSVVGINSGDDPQLASELLKQTGATFANLSDRDGAALAKVATARLPRTYLLDATGKIVWFDVEYSRTTRQNLLSAIRFSLKGQ